MIHSEKRQKVTQHRGAQTDDIADVLRAANQKRLLGGSQEELRAMERTPVALFYDLDAFDDTLEALRAAFSPDANWRHCLAVKANPLLKMLEMAVGKGFGLECASLSEVELSIKAQCCPSFIVYDSPCKTMNELRRALQLGVQINCDDFDEIDRVAKILLVEKLTSKSIIGVRINPLLGMGNIKALSVSDATSKFGIPYNDDNKAELIRCFQDYPFLNALHVHVGSQGCSLEMLAAGALTIYKFAEELGGPSRIKVLDIGGGLPTNFSSDETNPTFAEYAKVLSKVCSPLFKPTSGYTCVTEFGRSIQAKVGWVASACELVKEAGGRRIAVVHVGSDMFVRTCYCPADFPLRVQVVDGTTFILKDGDSMREHNVVGPLCFGGDKICEGKLLPLINMDDFVVIRDSGANCLSLWSRHCSRLSPPVYGYRRGDADNDITFQILRAQETMENVLKFWE